ncbi:Bacterial group 2 Ig-like protein (fragment) [Candidatus Desulfosporosinus infrequens]|uniref:Bacterial group 2 Ig-like protein n=1 Tax=Candidatus Desulfosporosinus infrequens TaxID=2043169 RepID=A0A2U3LCN6_9FIRM
MGSTLLKWGNSPNLAVTGVTLNHATLSLTAGGDPAVLLATVVPSIAANQVVTWASSNTNVTVATNGVVTPVSAGTATITATTQDGNKTATCTVTVSTP